MGTQKLNILANR